MRPRLLDPDRDLDLGAPLPADADHLVADLELARLIDAMAGTDRVLAQICRHVLLTGSVSVDVIRYRQAVLADCLGHREVVLELRDLALGALAQERRIWGGFMSRSPQSSLQRSVDVLSLFLGSLRRLRGIADASRDRFASDGFVRLFETLRTELADDYLDLVAEHLARLRFPGGIVMTARLADGARSSGHTLRKTARRGWRERLGLDHPGHTYRIPDRDEAGMDILAEMNARGLALAANSLARSTDHIIGFLTALQAELAFYVGCLALHDRLAAKGEPMCMPEPLPAGDPALTARGLYDPCLSLGIGARVVGNDLDADGITLIVVTGANHGGKSTFLRSLGVAQLMLQAGMFVAASSFRTDVRDGISTHFKRREDPTLVSGKFDEELRRMSAIVDHLTPTSLLLCNESFASTNEREGSEIASQIVAAVREAGVKVVYVTHMFDLAHRLHEASDPASLFLLAPRADDGGRSFRLEPGAPLSTSFGEDIYRRVFEASAGSRV